MIKISTIFVLGSFIAIIPFTGLPNDSDFPIKNFLYMACGLLVAILALLIRRELVEVIRHSYSDVVKTDTFSECNPKQEEDSQKL